MFYYMTVFKRNNKNTNLSSKNNVPLQKTSKIMFLYKKLLKITIQH